MRGQKVRPRRTRELRRLQPIGVSVVEGCSEREDGSRDDHAVDHDRLLLDAADQDEKRHPVVRRERRVGVGDARHPDRADHRAAESLPRKAQPRQVEVEIGGEPGTCTHPEPEQSRWQQFEHLLGPAELAIFPVADGRGALSQCEGDLAERHLVSRGELDPGELVAVGDDHKDVDGVPAVLAVVREPHVELRDGA